MNLSVKYLGYTLKNPLIIGSSALSNNLEKIKLLEKNNAGAIVLKSIFEEQILNEANHNAQDFLYPEAFDYLKEYTKSNNIDSYLKLIEDARKTVEIPIIASIHANTDGSWVSFAKDAETAGAHAIELNISLLPVDANLDGKTAEKIHLQILENVRKSVKIPIVAKISSYQSSLAFLIRQIAWSKNADAVVLFNRFYNPDIDINQMKVVVSNIFSNAEDSMPSLRWIALLSPQYDNFQFVASTGIYTGEDVIKQILVGANAVQIVSAIYKHGPSFINTILNQMKDWMQSKKFNSIADFRGKLSTNKNENHSVFERIQFMKYYGSIE